MPIRFYHQPEALRFAYRLLSFFTFFKYSLGLPVCIWWTSSYEFFKEIFSATADNSLLSLLQLGLDASPGDPKGLLLSVPLYDPGYRGFNVSVRPRQSLLRVRTAI